MYTILFNNFIKYNFEIFLKIEIYFTKLSISFTLTVINKLSFSIITAF